MNGGSGLGFWCLVLPCYTSGKDVLEGAKANPQESPRWGQWMERPMERKQGQFAQPVIKWYNQEHDLRNVSSWEKSNAFFLAS